MVVLILAKNSSDVNHVMFQIECTKIAVFYVFMYMLFARYWFLNAH